MNSQIFEQEKVSSAYMRLALPLVLSMVVTMIYNMADTYFVARTNDVNIVAGVSVCAPLFTIFMALGNIMAQGGSSLISRLLGAKNVDGVRRVSAFCFYITVMTGVILAAILLIFRGRAVYLLGADEQTFKYASEYYLYMSMGAPFVMLSFIHSNFLRSEGMSGLSMTGTMSGTVINIILDPIFITVLGMGAKGAAIATVIAYVFTDTFFVIIVLAKSRILSLNPREIRIPSDHLKQIYTIGIPAAIMNIMTALNVVIINHFLLPFGDDRIAAMGIILKISTIVQLVLTGLAFGGQPLFGYLYGEGNRKKLARLLRFSLSLISIAAVVLSAIMFFLAPVLMKLFMDNETVIELGIPMLRWRVASMLFVGIILLITILFQAFGKGIGSFILSSSRQGVVFILVLIAARQIAGYDGIIASQAVSDGITAVIAMILFLTLLRREFREE